jgi:hypothetical protein
MLRGLRCFYFLDRRQHGIVLIQMPIRPFRLLATGRLSTYRRYHATASILAFH